MWVKESFQINGKKTLLGTRLDSIDSSKFIAQNEKVNNQGKNRNQQKPECKSRIFVKLNSDIFVILND